MDKKKTISMLRAKKKSVVRELFSRADRVRKEQVGDAVYLRGLIEFSNHCGRDCLYCGLRASNRKLKRYRMSCAEIFSAAKKVRGLGIRTVVLQSGEDGSYAIEELCRLVKKIKALGLAVTLSIGERSYQDYKLLKAAGADRYLLRFETSDARLYAKLRPGRTLANRLRCLAWLKKLGYQVGSGAMVGLPGQTDASIAEDIFLYKRLGLDMIGIGPFIPHPHTPLAKASQTGLEKVLRVLALTRIVTKNTHIPATTAVGTIDSRGRQKALQSGANIIMPNCTPVKYRKLYQIYPDKISLSDDAVKCRRAMLRMIIVLGRSIGKGYGHSLRKR
jgi:biotin synthase